MASPTCTCDGEISNGSCRAYADEQEVDINASCGPVDGYFACGYTYCRLDTEYCEVREPTNSSPSRRCMDIPVACKGSPTCECLAERCVATDCRQDADGQFRVVCSL